MYEAVHDVAWKHASPDRQCNDCNILHLHHRLVQCVRTVYAQLCCVHSNSHVTSYSLAL
jgi:hypothetical protein